MPEQIVSPPIPSNAPEFPIYELYRQLLQAWNEQDAAAFAASFADDGDAIGFDGSIMDGRAEIESSLGGVSADHETADYVALVRKVSLLSPHTAVLRAVVGMVPPGKEDLNPEQNAVQSSVAHHVDGQWRIALFQNTPARFHGRPELAEALTRELQDRL